MAVSSLPAREEIATVTCVGGCGKSFRRLGLICGGSVAAFRIADLPAGWLVVDLGPPGDAGLGFACSEACFVEGTR